MLVRDPDLQFDEFEARVRRLLTGAVEVDSDVQLACDYLSGALNLVLASVETGHPWRSWNVDDFLCQELCRNDPVVSLVGWTCWLSGGDDCGKFRIDISLETAPLLYSYKFKHPKTQAQTFYAGKTRDGWILSDS